MSLILSGTNGLSDVDGSAATPAIRGTDANTGMFFPAADTIAFAEGGTESMRLDSSGNLGLGVTPSAWSLGKAIEVGFIGKGIWANNQNEVIYHNNAYYNSGWKYSVTGYQPSQYAQRDGLHAWYTAASGTAGNAISFTQAMTLDASGNLGVGTTSPNNYSGYGNITLNGSSGGIFDLSVGNTRTGSFYATSSLVVLSARTAIPLVFETNALERARIDSSGNLLVGTTSTSPGNGNTTTGISIVPTSSSCFSVNSSSFTQVINNNFNDSGTFYLVNFRTGGGNRGSILSNGTGVTYNTLSDYRLKENIAPMTGALAKVAALKPCTYIWKENGQVGQGFIAHELQEVVPDCVTGEKDAVDEDGNIKPQGIDTSFLVATLTAAIQELKAELDAAKARITALEA